MKIKNFLIPLGAIVAVVVAVSMLPANAPMHARYVKSDSNNSDEVTRITCALIARPHVSNRIDSVYLLRPGKKHFKATDIDGIDFQRYFQWEDDDYIMVDIDFPLQKRRLNVNDTIVIYAVNGVVKTSCR